MRRVACAVTVFAGLIPCALAAQQVETATTVAFTEGPTADRDGKCTTSWCSSES
jgi:hypothetical protein